MKRQALIAFVAVIVIIVITTFTDRTITVLSRDVGHSTNKTTCINGFDSLKEAKVQIKLLDQQILLSKATGQTEDAVLISTRSSNLKEMITVLEKLIADPKLDCGKYLKDEPKVTRKVI